MNRWFDRIQIWRGYSLGFSDTLNNFWEVSIENKMDDGGHLKKNSHPKSLWAWYLLNHWLDCIQIWCSGSLGISNDLINFRE